MAPKESALTDIGMMMHVGEQRGNMKWQGNRTHLGLLGAEKGDLADGYLFLFKVKSAAGKKKLSYKPERN